MFSFRGCTMIFVLRFIAVLPLVSITSCLNLQPNDHDHDTDKVAESMLAVSKDHIEVSHLCVSGSGELLSLRIYDLSVVHVLL